MNLYRRTPKPRKDRTPDAARRRPQGGEGSAAARRRPDPQAEPIPDGERGYVPRSPYRTGHH